MFEMSSIWKEKPNQKILTPECTYIQLIRAGPLTGSLEFKINHRIFDLHVQILFVAKASRSVAPALCGQRNLIQNFPNVFLVHSPGKKVLSHTHTLDDDTLRSVVETRTRANLI